MFLSIYVFLKQKGAGEKRRETPVCVFLNFFLFFTPLLFLQKFDSTLFLSSRLLSKSKIRDTIFSLLLWLLFLKRIRRRRRKKEEKASINSSAYCLLHAHVKNAQRRSKTERRATRMTDAITNNNKDRDELFNALCRKKGNRLCFDCNTPNPKWTSKNYCVFICLDCSGIHRSLGVHISQVKSANMDRWSRDELDVFKASGGNDAARAFFSQHGWNSNERGKR